MIWIEVLIVLVLFGVGAAIGLLRDDRTAAVVSGLLLAAAGSSLRHGWGPSWLPAVLMILMVLCLAGWEILRDHWAPR